MSEELLNFEAWARDHVGQFSSAGFYGEGGEWVYRHNIVRLMWKCWRARAETPQSIPSEREEIVKWLEETAGPGALVGDDVTRFMLGIAQSIRDGKHLTRQCPFVGSR